MINRARGPGLCFRVAPLGLERSGAHFYKHDAPSGANRTGICLIQRQYTPFLTPPCLAEACANAGSEAERSQAFPVNLPFVIYDHSVDKVSDEVCDKERRINPLPNLKMSREPDHSPPFSQSLKAECRDRCEPPSGEKRPLYPCA